MANMIDLDSSRKLSYYFNFETLSLNVLQLMESIFGPVPINPVNIEDSLINENWPVFISFRNLERILNTTEADEVRFDLCNVNSFLRTS